MKDKHDPRDFEHLAKVDRDGVVVAMVEVASSSDWEHWTDAEGHRYVYVTDILPLDIHGLALLPAMPVPPRAVAVSKSSRTKK